jgi:hypothetical protein
MCRSLGNPILYEVNSFIGANFYCQFDQKYIRKMAGKYMLLKAFLNHHHKHRNREGNKNAHELATIISLSMLIVFRIVTTLWCVASGLACSMFCLGCSSSRQCARFQDRGGCQSDRFTVFFSILSVAPSCLNGSVGGSCRAQPRDRCVVLWLYGFYQCWFFLSDFPYKPDTVSCLYQFSANFPYRLAKFPSS